MYVEPLAGVALNVSVILPVVALFSPVTLETAPVPPTILQTKMGVSGHVFVKLIAIVGFAAAVPLAVTVAVKRWLVPLAATVAELPQPLDSVMFDPLIELPRFATRKVPCTVPAKEIAALIVAEDPGAITFSAFPLVVPEAGAIASPSLALDIETVAAPKALTAFRSFRARKLPELSKNETGAVDPLGSRSNMCPVCPVLNCAIRLGAVPLAAPRNWPPALLEFWLVPFTVPCTLRFEYTVSAPPLPLSASGANRGSEGMGPLARNASSK